MSRFLKVMGAIALSSATVMAVPCSYTDHGFSILPSVGSALNINLGGLIPGLG